MRRAELAKLREPSGGTIRRGVARRRREVEGGQQQQSAEASTRLAGESHGSHVSLYYSRRAAIAILRQQAGRRV
jgi:hypothetical protein